MVLPRENIWVDWTQMSNCNILTGICLVEFWLTGSQMTNAAKNVIKCTTAVCLLTGFYRGTPNYQNFYRDHLRKKLVCNSSYTSIVLNNNNHFAVATCPVWPQAAPKIVTPEPLFLSLLCVVCGYTWICYRTAPRVDTPRWFHTKAYLDDFRPATTHGTDSETPSKVSLLALHYFREDVLYKKKRATLAGAEMSTCHAEYSAIGGLVNRAHTGRKCNSHLPLYNKVQIWRIFTAKLVYIPSLDHILN